ncbi:MAG: sulfotransferase, partial [Deltaproteobacteria bacterium]|nr:sulfotransferase [Deltaproteobacteria bacterium]
MNLLDSNNPRGRLLMKTAGQLAGALSRLEGMLFGDAGPLHPPIFILGLPRGGTTLMYQVLCHCYRFAYPSMAANSLPFSAALVSWLCRRFRGDYVSDFQSHYGRLRGLTSPGEGTMWNLWFEKDRTYRSANDVRPDAVREMVRMVGRIERIYGHPFINKNLRHVNRLPALAEIFPRCLFVVIMRNPRDAVLSLLRGRLEMQGSFNRWFSVRPRSFVAHRDLAPERQVVFQIKGLIDDLLEDMPRIGTKRFIAVPYEEFCRSPANHLSMISSFLSGHGVPVLPSHPPPKPFLPVRDRTDMLTGAQLTSIDRALEEAFSADPYLNLRCVWSGERNAI